MRWIAGARGLKARTNSAVNDLASSIDGQTREVARQAAPVLVLAVQLLRWPALALLLLPVPALFGLLAIIVLDSTLGVRWAAFGILAAISTVLVLFGIRRHQIIEAVSDPDALATELAIAVELTGRVDDSRDVLLQIAGRGRVGVFARLRGLWRGFTLPDGWIGEIGDLPRARQFFPPSVGSSVTLAVAALVMTPVAYVIWIVMFVVSLSV
jgi:hypothetical protein